MNTIKRIKYGLNLAFGREQHLAFTIKEVDGRLKLDIMSSIEDNDTLLLLTPYMQGIIYQSMGTTDNWEMN